MCFTNACRGLVVLRYGLGVADVMVEEDGGRLECVLCVQEEAL